MFEINLVPDVKDKMIRALKLQNLILFVSIVVTVACVGIILILWSIKGGQDLAMADQDKVLTMMSDKIASYDDIETILTLQSQLNGMEGLIEDRTVMSRVFDVLDVLSPTNGDTIKYSEVKFDVNSATIEFQAQIRAGEMSKNNFNALDAFAKSMAIMNFDYGRYVDENGNEIPTRCITETMTKDSITATWTKGRPGCNPSGGDGQAGFAGENNAVETVTIYRTPTVTKVTQDGSEILVADMWYKEGKMTEDGAISGVPHFESECISYSGFVVNETDATSSDVKWSDTKNCPLVPDGAAISDAVDAKDSTGEMVGMFSATIPISEEVFKFENKHVIAIGPTGRTNMTDSYRQFQNLFTEAATQYYGE